MAHDCRVGDLVVCASKAYREQAGLGLDVGLYLVDRRRDGLVLFARPDRSAWVPKELLRTVRADDPRLVAPPAWVVRVNRAMRLLEATDLELERDETGRLEARIGCPGLDGAMLRELEALAGEDASGLRLRPGSMSRLLVVFPLGQPGPAGAGTGADKAAFDKTPPRS